MKSIVQLLGEIEKKPPMYLGRNSIFCLDAFLGGVGWADNNISDYDILDKFEKWIIEKYHIQSSHGWASIIHFYSTDECGALKNFFKLFNEFKKLN